MGPETEGKERSGWAQEQREKRDLGGPRNKKQRENGVRGLELPNFSWRAAAAGLKPLAAARPLGGALLGVCLLVC